jgi:hypothetical protein
MAPTTFPSTPTEAYALDYQNGGNIYWWDAIASEKWWHIVAPAQYQLQLWFQLR